MRLIWSSEDLKLVQQFRALLHSKGIETFEETVVNENWDSDHYNIPIHKLWIYDEDRIQETEQLLNEFLEKLPLYEVQNEGKQKPKNTRYSISFILLLLCTFLFLTDYSSSKKISEIPPALYDKILTTSPVEKWLFYDYPEAYEIMDKLIDTYGYTAVSKPKTLPPDGQFLYKTYLDTPVFHGLYPDAKKSTSQSPPLFEKISEGEIWRLFTPILLHADLLHLFFNMVWLAILGKEMEKHLSSARFILFILLAALFSNTAQYLMSGSAFLGFSGVICAMAFFIHQRQKVAPWEGYELSKPTFQFILFFIGILASLSFVSLILELLHISALPIRIANTAHLAGALIGACLGHLPFFKEVD